MFVAHTWVGFSKIIYLYFAASIHSAGTPLGSFVSGILMDRYGRKTALQLSVVPLIIGWIMIAFAGK